MPSSWLVRGVSGSWLWGRLRRARDREGSLSLAFRWPFADQYAYWRFLTETAASVSRVLRDISPKAQETVRERVHETVRVFCSGEGYDFPAICLNVVTC